MGTGSERVTIVDRHEMVAGALEGALSTRAFECRRVVTAGLTPGMVVRRVLRGRADVVLLSMDLGCIDPSPVIASTHDQGCPVVALVADESDSRVGEALWAGADSIAPKSWSLDRLAEVVEGTLHGQSTIDPSVRGRLLAEYEAGVCSNRTRVARLTVQEKDLLAHLMEGRTVGEVAKTRTVSEATVRTQAKAIMTKLEVSSQLTAVAIARLAGYHPDALHAQQPSEGQRRRV